MNDTCSVAHALQGTVLLLRTVLKRREELLKRINPGYKISPGDNNVLRHSAGKQFRYKTPNPIYCSHVRARFAAESVAL